MRCSCNVTKYINVMNYIVQFKYRFHSVTYAPVSLLFNVLKTLRLPKVVMVLVLGYRQLKNRRQIQGDCTRCNLNVAEHRVKALASQTICLGYIVHAGKIKCMII